jgi:hypothetical protein
MTEQEWLDNVAAQLPERDLEWVLDLARICSTQWTGGKPPTGGAGETSEPGAPSPHAPLAQTVPAEESEAA